jgi:uroporphyrinogen-III synthase
VNVHHREPHEHTPKEISLLLFLGEQMGGAIAMSLLAGQNARLREEAVQIREQLEVRKLVERAKGILQQRYQWTEQQAYRRLREESRRLRKPIREIAEAVLLVESLGQDESAPTGS